MSSLPPNLPPPGMPIPPNAEILRRKRLFSNLASGLAVTAFMAGIYFYTMAKVSTNDFKQVDDKGNIKRD